ncbi:hypothetical protein H5410_040422 [Solanum commersonii]|uniref:Uncharacterized protein n=1 Tax=Solanum commersonii TaxID=4109 RepID=A0A9J5XRC6_SOLCO|nr:hypothetical protein H5410_040422 [Solanum commersonii]
MHIIKTEFTHAKIKCALKVSNCDPPILKNLKLTILASNTSSSSTKAFKCPHKKNDSIFPHNGSQFKVSESTATLTLIKMYTMHDFTHRGSNFSQNHGYKGLFVFLDLPSLFTTPPT